MHIIQPTAPMRDVAQYVIEVARDILQVEVRVTFVQEPNWHYQATYGQGSLTFNIGSLGEGWFDLAKNKQAIDKLLIHEFGHNFTLDHLSGEYHDALCEIGARMIKRVEQMKKDEGHTWR